MYRGNANPEMKSNALRSLNVPQLLFAHAEIMPDLVNDRKSDLSADLCVGVADALDVFLVEHDVRRTRRRIKHAPLGGRNADEDP